MSEKTRKGSPVDDLLADVEAYLDDWFQTKLPFALHGGVRWTPATDVYETETAVHVAMDLPGMSADDVTVAYDRDILKVSGDRREPCGDRRRYHKMEIPVGPFERRIRLPRSIIVDDIEVTYTAGLLRIVVPKRAAVEVPIEGR